MYLAGLLSEKCDIENVTSAPARAFALEQIQKIMFGNDLPASIPAKTGMYFFVFLSSKGKSSTSYILCS